MSGAKPHPHTITPTISSSSSGTRSVRNSSPILSSALARASVCEHVLCAMGGGGEFPVDPQVQVLMVIETWPPKAGCIRDHSPTSSCLFCSASACSSSGTAATSTSCLWGRGEHGCYGHQTPASVELSLPMFSSEVERSVPNYVHNSFMTGRQANWKVQRSSVVVQFRPGCACSRQTHTRTACIH